MAESGFAKYVRRTDFDAQDIVLESAAAADLGAVLRPHGAKRVYMICSSPYLKYKAVRDVAANLKEAGFPAFVYSRLAERCSSSDIMAAFKEFWDYNCNTIVSIGDDEDCCLAKMTAALAACRGKELKDIKGINRIRGTMPVLCHIPMDNGSGAGTASSHYYDEENRKTEYVYSRYLLPKIVVIDTDLSLHIPMSESVDSGLYSLAMALDSYVDRDSVAYPEYRADAETACLSFIANAEKMKNNPGDSYLRRNISVASLYAGMSTRRVGKGVSNVTADVLRNHLGTVSGTCCLAVAARMFEDQSDVYASALSSLAKAAFLCPANTDDFNGATTFIEYLRRLCYKNRSESAPISISAEDAEHCAEEIRRVMSDIFGKKVSAAKIADVLVAVSAEGAQA